MTQDLIDLQERYDLYLDHLTAITNGLVEMANAAGRTGYTKNQLLQECYDLCREELHTLDEWHALGRYVKEREHGYLFWNTNGGAEFRFTQEQLMSKNYELEFISKPKAGKFVQLSLFD